MFSKNAPMFNSDWSFYTERVTTEKPVRGQSRAFHGKISKTEGKITYYFLLPGLTRDKISVKLFKETFEVSFVDDGVIKYETFPLESVDTDSAKCLYQNGTLSVTFNIVNVDKESAITLKVE